VRSSSKYVRLGQFVTIDFVIRLHCTLHCTLLLGLNYLRTALVTPPFTAIFVRTLVYFYTVPCTLHSIALFTTSLHCLCSALSTALVLYASLYYVRCTHLHTSHSPLHSSLCLYPLHPLHSSPHSSLHSPLHYLAMSISTLCIP
jgi:hypothetical protein